MLESIKNYLKFLKDKIKGVFFFFKALIKLRIDEVFFDSNDKETPREVIKSIKEYLNTKFSIKEFYNKHILNLRLNHPFIGIVLEYLFKYLLVFIFILWILFESFFFRFYLVDTPFDTKIDPSRKEGGRKKRFLPVIGFETLSFYNRPFWRIFNNLMVFMSNLGALGFLIYYVYILDFWFAAKVVFNWFIYFVILAWGLILSILKFINRYLKQFLFVLLLFYWRINFCVSNIFSTLNYLFLLPFIMLFNILHFFIFGLYRSYFLFSLINVKEVKELYKKVLKKKNWFRFNSIYEFVFNLCFFFEYFINYLYLKLSIYDLGVIAHKKKYNFNKFSDDFIYFKIWFKQTRLYKLLKILFLFLKFLYLFTCYFVLFLFIFILFLNYIYFPFF